MVLNYKTLGVPQERAKLTKNKDINEEIYKRVYKRFKFMRKYIQYANELIWRKRKK